MALQIQKIFNNGVSAEYWKVVKTNIDWLTQKANISVYCYIDKKTRDEGKEPICSKNIQFEAVKDFGGKSEFQFLVTDNIIAKSYELLKKDDFFLGAKDIL